MDTNLIECPYCKELIIKGARKCKHCGEWLTDSGGMEAADPESMVRHAVESHYEILEEIGRGGMATVYRAVQKSLGREVALKVLPSQYTHDREFTERFHREARSAASLNHPNIITIYDEGVLGGVNFIAMALVEGEDLHNFIKEKGRLSEEEVKRILIPIAEGLGYAHDKGMVHRDIKSANILLDSNGVPVLTDFGIAHAGEGTKLTRTGTVLGTPEYMSPEQAKGEGTDKRSDIYSLGIILYECLTGDLPFTGDTALGVVHKITTEKPAMIRYYRRDITPSFERVILRCLEKDPEKRYQSCEDLVTALIKGEPERAEEPNRGSAFETVKFQSSEAARKTTREEVPVKKAAAPPDHTKQVRTAGNKKNKKAIILIAAAAVVLSAGLVFAILGITGALIPKPGSMDVSSEPAGAEVYVNGNKMGTTPMLVENLAEGSHKLRIVKKGSSGNLVERLGNLIL